MFSLMCGVCTNSMLGSDHTFRERNGNTVLGSSFSDMTRLIASRSACCVNGFRQCADACC